MAPMEAAQPRHLQTAPARPNAQAPPTPTRHRRAHTQGRYKHHAVTIWHDMAVHRPHSLPHHGVLAMARPKKYASAADRQAAHRAKRNETCVTKPCHETLPRNETPLRNETLRNDSFVAFEHQAHVPLSLFDGLGRGTIRRHTDGIDYVLVSRHVGPDVGELGVVSAADWSARLGQRCEHGRGWACHSC